MLDFDIVWLDFENLIEKWVGKRDSLNNLHDDFNEGYRHAYQESTRAFDDSAVYARDPAAIESQYLDLMQKTEYVSWTGTRYNKGYRLGMGEVRADLEALRKNSMG